MKRKAVQILCLVLAILIGLSALGGGAFALISEWMKKDPTTPLFNYNEQLYVVTDQEAESAEKDMTEIPVQKQVKANVAPKESGTSNFCPVGDVFLLAKDGTLYYEYNNTYLTCIPVESSPKK